MNDSSRRPLPDSLDDPDESRIADLTVSELQELIRKTVQEAVAEVIIEFSIAAEVDARLSYEAELMERSRRPRTAVPHSRADD